MQEITYPCYYIYRDSSGGWRWAYYASNGKVLALGSESFGRRDDCSRAVSLMMSSSRSRIYYVE